jgi:methanogenic corrinoid protein MtbC1
MRRVSDDFGKSLNVSTEAALEYEAQGEKMLKRVNELMSERGDISELLGMNPLYIMYDNNSNHLRLITNVLKLNDYDLLARTLPWVYKTYTSRNFSNSFFPEVLKAWMQSVNEFLSPEGSKQVIAVYEAMLDAHEASVKTSEDALVGMNVEAPWKAVEQKVVIALLKGSYRELQEISTDLIKDEKTLSEFYLKVVQPAMYEIGSLWQTGEISVAEEHLATSLMNRLIASTYSMIETVPSHPRRKAVVLSSQNEYHELGARILADLLELSGWNVSYLGANTPVSEVLKHLKKNIPFLLALSVTMSFNLDHTKKLIHSIRFDNDFKAMKIMVGGLVINESEDLWKRLGADGTASSAAEAVEMAKQWWEERG